VLAKLRILLLAAGIGCGTDPSPPGPAGNFETSFADDQAYLALTISERDGALAGTGWLSGGGILGRYAFSGTYTSPEVEIQLASDNDADGEPDSGAHPLTLVGTLQGAHILGRLTGEPDLQVDLTFTRVDTTAGAVFQWSVEGATTITQRGVASFTIPHGLELHLSPGLESDMVVLGGRLGRPQVGRYPIGLDTASSYQAYLFAEEPSPVASLYRAVSGELRVDVSTPQVLIGSFTFTADDVYEPRRVTVTGWYSAGCGYTRCE
jgi:hypothetical protein